MISGCMRIVAIWIQYTDYNNNNSDVISDDYDDDDDDDESDGPRWMIIYIYGFWNGSKGKLFTFYFPRGGVLYSFIKSTYMTLP